MPGLFFIALSTLMYEILLTRIFSVTMWFHFAFVAVSIAMFGMTVGALLVYLNPGHFSDDKVQQRLSLHASLFSITIVLSFLAHLYIPFVTDVSIKNIFFIGLTYAVIAIPFIFSGVCVCLSLTKYPKVVGRLYAADLVGAAIGCFLLVWLLGVVDASSAVFIVACLASLAALIFSSGERSGARKLALAVTFAVLAAAVTHTVSSTMAGSPFFRLRLVKGSVEGKPFYEKWNSFSRITVDGDPNGESAFGWGLSSLHAKDKAPEELWLRIDSGAATPMTRNDGDYSKLNYLKYDITNLAHYLKKNADVLVMGTGGGRDILSALVFEQRSVRGVEINGAILDTANRKYGDFTGHLDRDPRVTFINDEARSYIARTQDKFDIMQVSFIDTNAATAAGAFVFTENSLYTVEAWKIFLDHLTPTGILTFSRWYYLDLSGEVYRMLLIADQALRSMGIEDPRQHILCVKNVRGGDYPDVGTLMVSRSPFTSEQLREGDRVSRELNYEVVLSPEVSKDPVFDKLLGSDGEAREKFLKEFPINVSASTDDNPFFFSMVRPWQALDKNLWNFKLATFNIKAIFVLAALLLIVTLLTSLCIVVPLSLTKDKQILKGSLPHLTYFAMIGFGFMFIEISQMQRLSLFLGHPVYGLSVVLFTLLLSSGLGSFACGSIGIDHLRAQGKVRLLLLIAMLIGYGLFTTTITERFQSLDTPARILISIALLAPLGFLMGMAFPLGMLRASAARKALTPWLWGINGATSVFASVLAVILAISFGVPASYWTGLACYLIALAAFLAV
jgi:hypothetical protein